MNPKTDTSVDRAVRTPRAAVAIVAVSIAGILALTLWYLVRPQPLLVQGEADATRVDIAARVDGRVATRLARRGENVQAGQVLVTIDNPELVTQLKQAEAARDVAAADLKRIIVGTRVEVVDSRRAALEAAEANAKLAEQTWNRTRQLTARDFASVQKLDEATANLDVARRSRQQAKLALVEAINGYTAEEHGVAQATVVKAEAAIATLQAQVAELTVKSPLTGQVYHTDADPGEYVSPGVPLLTLVDLSDVWVRFELREDLVSGLKIGDRFEVRVPALGDKLISVEVRKIATRGEYAGWRATRATGDFDLRTFEIHAYPVEPVPGLRPGMSVYADWKSR
ncbi:MAG: efflux RND transporter periplasmic adaptor subunit [Alphaproteobacteria bacterium]|nr:efflux RND transporter periplasmic adaptor subunit [Alphaproteobacteria bacterium]